MDRVFLPINRITQEIEYESLSPMGLIGLWVKVPLLAAEVVKRAVITEHSDSVDDGSLFVADAALQRIYVLSGRDHNSNLQAMPWLKRRLALPQKRSVLKRSEVKRQKTFGEFAGFSLSLAQELFERSHFEWVNSSSQLWIDFWVACSVLQYLDQLTQGKKASSKNRLYKQALEQKEITQGIFNDDLGLIETDIKIANHFQLCFIMAERFWMDARFHALNDRHFDTQYFKPFEKAYLNLCRDIRRSKGVVIPHILPDGSIKF